MGIGSVREIVLPSTNRSMRTLMVAALAAVSLAAADSFYLGTWTIASAVVAPWADPAAPPDPREMKSLIGKTVAIKPGEMIGPGLFACKGPIYKVRDYPADWLFQGQFGEMRDRDHTVDPAKVAAKLGFRGTSWKTLETGCANEIDYHFVDADTAEIGLNDYVYTLKRKPAK